MLNLPNEVKLCNKHDLFLEYLDQCMKVSTELRFTFCVHIQYNGDTPLFDYSKNSSTVRKNDFNQSKTRTLLHKVNSDNYIDNHVYITINLLELITSQK